MFHGCRAGTYHRGSARGYQHQDRDGRDCLQTAGDCNVIKLLGRQTSGNVQKVIFCLEELNVPYVREDYGRQFGNTATEAYRRLNPNAKVPTLLEGDLAIWESHTILRYLARIPGHWRSGDKRVV